MATWPFGSQRTEKIWAGVAEMVRGNGDVDVCLVRIVGALGVVFVNQLVVAIGLRW